MSNLGPISVVPADRPDKDEDIRWRQLVSSALGDKWRQDDYAKLEFVECDSCNEKPGSPSLCAGCLANRNTIYRLRMTHGR